MNKVQSGMNNTILYIELQAETSVLPTSRDWNIAILCNIIYQVTCQGLTPVMINNMRLNEMEIFVIIAVKAGYRIKVLEPVTPWAFKWQLLLLKGVHFVPEEKICKKINCYTMWKGEFY